MEGNGKKWTQALVRAYHIHNSVIAFVMLQIGKANL